MSTVIVDDVRLEIPDWVKDLNTFRRWTDDSARYKLQQAQDHRELQGDDVLPIRSICHSGDASGDRSECRDLVVVK